jgi:hypothetical protein
MLGVIMLNVIMSIVFTLSVMPPDTAITLKVDLSTNVSRPNGFLPKGFEPFCLFPYSFPSMILLTQLLVQGTLAEGEGTVQLTS